MREASCEVEELTLSIDYVGAEELNATQTSCEVDHISSCQTRKGSHFSL